MLEILYVTAKLRDGGRCVMKCLRYASLPSSGTRWYRPMSSKRDEMLVMCVTAKCGMMTSAVAIGSGFV